MEGSGTMSHYKSNLRDIEFNLFEVFGRQELLGKPPFDEVDADTAHSILSEVERLASNELAESLLDSDRNPPVFDPATVAPGPLRRIRDFPADGERLVPSGYEAQAS